MIDPSELVQHKFLGLPCGKGVAPAFRDRLVAVERALEQSVGLRGRELGRRMGVNAGLICFRRDHGRHGLGRAIDIEYSGAPYIAVRSKRRDGQGYIYGGEAAAAGLVGLRESAAGVYDRAVAWIDPEGPPADVACRRAGESTGAVWDRLRRVSDALSVYLGVVFAQTPSSVTRPPGTPPAPAELAAENDARALIQARWPGADVAAIQTQIIADFDHVRVPMVFGAPSRRPARTRNPARGFLPFTRELAVSMVELGGMRWGACDFGPAESGDIMHFDR